MLLKNLIVPLLATTATVTATFDLTTSLTKYASFDFGCGDISISKGAEFSLINKFESSFQGDISIEKDCKFFLASTAAKALKVTVSGLFNKIVNKGIWVVHSLDAIKSATCNIVGASFENTGQCIFAVKAEIVKIVSLKWINSGCLHFYQDIKSLCVAEIGAWLGFLTNHGTICLTNYKCKNSASIIGSGCIAIEKDSSFYIANSLLQIDTKHTFYLGAGNPTIQASPNVFPQTFNVANFGGSHKIGLDCPLASASFFGQKAFSYDSKKGILTLRANGMASQNFKIGLGYDEKKFSICSDDSIGAVSVKNGAVQYNGPCPNPGRPTICLACPPPPEVPGTTPCTTTSTITSTKTNGQICTEIDEVIISTDATGSWFTSTSTTVNCGQTSQATSIPHTQVTVTSTYTGLTTATTTVSGSSTDTVYVEVPSVPHSQVTTTTTSTGITEVTATTITGTSTDTVLVIVPATTASTSTVTNTWTGSFTTTVTTGDLVIVEVPSSDFSSTVSTSTTAETTSTEGETAETGTTEDETASTATTEGETGNGQFSTSYVTVTAETTSFITITSCSNNGCHQTTAPTGVTVVTVTESDVSTVFTTYCPLTQTHTLGVSKSSTVDLGCPTGYFGYDGLPGKNIHFDFSLSKSIGFYVEANKFINIGSHHKREESNSTKSGSSSSANAGAMNTIYGVEFLSAVAIVLAFVF